MIKYIVTLLLVLFTSFAISQLKTKTKIPFEQQFQSNVKEERIGEEIRRTTQTHQFFFYDSYPLEEGKSGSLFIHQTSDIVSSNFMEGSDGILTINAYMNEKERYDKPVWTIVDSAEQSELWRNFIKTTNFACCGSENTYRYYNVVTGTKILSSSIPLARIEVYDSPDVPSQKTMNRYVAYLSSEVLKDNPFDKTDETIIGKLMLASDDAVLQSLILHDTSKSEIQPAWSPKVSVFRDDYELKDERTEIWFEGNVTEQNEKAVTGVFVRLVFTYMDDEREVLVPILDGRFDVSFIQKPDKIAIEEIGEKND
ncbi:MAG: hypothetical protein HY960_04540 [Ignavibacteriae bacterium]|nr:hypothetical protein [Ignavibacteriota bacterium]